LRSAFGGSQTPGCVLVTTLQLAFSRLRHDTKVSTWSTGRLRGRRTTRRRSRTNGPGASLPLPFAAERLYRQPDSAMPPRTAPFEVIAACHAALNDAASAEVAEWLPDAVPPTIGLGALGAALVSGERDIDDESLDRLASCVEELLSPSDADADAVATGFLEAICNRSD